MGQKVELACIIDDDKIYVNLVKKIIEIKKLSKNLLIFKNGKEALDHFKLILENASEEVLPDIIFLDINMPVMDGITATQNIRKISDVPIIALTAVEIEEARERIYSSGMNDIIIKPYDIKELKNKIATTIISYRSSK